MNFGTPNCVTRFLYISMLLHLSGCAAWAWNKYKIPVQPNYSCQTGMTSGYEIWVWNCYDNKHIVIYQASAEFNRREAEREIVPCGQKTKFEQKLALEGPSSKICNTHYRPPWGDEKLKMMNQGKKE